MALPTWSIKQMTAFPGALSFVEASLAGVLALTGRCQQSRVLAGPQSLSFHQDGYPLGFFSKGSGVLDAAWAKQRKRERDFSGLFLRDIGSSSLVCKGARGQGKGAINQLSVSPF